MKHPEIIRLIIAYTLVGAFVFTAVVTCLSLVGWIQFADPDQQKKLFYVLIVEVVAGSVGLFFNFLSFNPSSAGRKIEQRVVESVDLPLAEETAKAAAEDAVARVVTSNETNAEEPVEIGAAVPESAPPETHERKAVNDSATARESERPAQERRPSVTNTIITIRVDSANLQGFRLMLDGKTLHRREPDIRVSVAVEHPHILGWTAIGKPGTEYSVELLHEDRRVEKKNLVVSRTPSVGAFKFVVAA